MPLTFVLTSLDKKDTDVKNLLVAALAACALLPLPALAHHIQTAETTSVRIYATVHTIPYVDPGGPLTDQADQFICSGFIISSHGTEQAIATARHCTADEEETIFGMPVADVFVKPTIVRYFDGDMGHVYKVYQDPDSDVAILFVHSVRKHEAAPVSRRQVERGDSLFVFGNPEGLPWVFQPATVLNSVETDAVSTAPGFAGLLMIQCAACAPGDSGGGVYDFKGNAMGIFVAYSTDPPYGMYVPMYRVVNALERAFADSRQGSACAANALSDRALLVSTKTYLNPLALINRLETLSYQLDDCEQQTRYHTQNHTKLVLAFIQNLTDMAVEFKAYGDNETAFEGYQIIGNRLSFFRRWAQGHNDKALLAAVVDASNQFDLVADASGISTDPNPSDDKK